MIQSIVKSRVYHLSLYLAVITFYEKSVLTYMSIFIAFEHNINRFWKRININGVQAMSILFKHKSILIAFESKVTLIAFEHNPTLIAFEQKTISISYEHIQTQINIISIWAQILVTFWYGFFSLWGVSLILLKLYLLKLLMSAKIRNLQLHEASISGKASYELMITVHRLHRLNFRWDYNNEPQIWSELIILLGIDQEMF